MAFTIRHSLFFDKKKDGLTKKLDQQSKRTRKLVLPRHAFRRYLNVRLAYFVYQDELTKTRFRLLRLPKKTIIVRLVLRLRNETEWRQRVANRNRGAQPYNKCAFNPNDVNWLCQTIEKTAAGKVVREVIFSEKFLIEKGVLYENLWTEDGSLFASMRIFPPGCELE